MSKKVSLWQSKKYTILFAICATVNLLMMACVAGGVKAIVLLGIVGITFFRIMRDEVLSEAVSIKKYSYPICATLAAGILLITMGLSVQMFCVMAVAILEARAIYK